MKKHINNLLLGSSNDSVEKLQQVYSKYKPICKLSVKRVNKKVLTQK